MLERLLGTEHFVVASDIVRARRADGRSRRGGGSQQSRLATMQSAEPVFTAQNPDLIRTVGSRAARGEYGRLDADRHVYLDYTGGGLHAASQIDAHAELLRTSVLGNPHSNNPTSSASTVLVERARRRGARFFNAPPDEYICVFTANASAALRLVGESYRFAPGGTYALTFDNHNSVNGIREFARRKGAAIAYVPVVAPELRLDRRRCRGRSPAGDRVAQTCSPFPPSRTSPACSTPSISSQRRTPPDGTYSSTRPPSLRPTGSTSPGSGPTSRRSPSTR